MSPPSPQLKQYPNPSCLLTLLAYFSMTLTSTDIVKYDLLPHQTEICKGGDFVGWYPRAQNGS